MVCAVLVSMGGNDIVVGVNGRSVTVVLRLRLLRLFLSIVDELASLTVATPYLASSHDAQGMAGAALTKRIDCDSRFIRIERLALAILIVILPAGYVMHMFFFVFFG